MDAKKKRKKTDPALNIMGGKRYMKKRSSLNTRRRELFPLLINKITTPVASPCSHSRWFNQLPEVKFPSIQENRQFIQWILTIIKAVMDSFIHRFSSRRWPRTIQAQRSATKRLSETTEAWSEVDNDGIFDTKESKNDAIIVIFYIAPTSFLMHSQDTNVHKKFI